MSLDCRVGPSVDVEYAQRESDTCVNDVGCGTPTGLIGPELLCENMQWRQSHGRSCHGCDAR
eukprot:14241473-Alexandrium_andersonii.AAC.1